MTTVLRDDDGVPQAVNYRWFANNQPISQASKRTYTLTAAEVGKLVHVTAEYTDNKGTVETVKSALTTPICLSKVAPDGSCRGHLFIDSFEDKPN